MSIVDDILRGAEAAARQGLVRPHVLFMNQRDHESMMDSLEFNDVQCWLRQLGGTYQEYTTRLGRLQAARRLAGRRGRRFHAKRWLARQ